MASDDQRAMAKDVRAILKSAYDRGVDAGRKLGYIEGLEQAQRQAMLETQAEALESAANKVTDEPAESCFREAASILRDLADKQPTQSPEEEPKEIDRQAVSG